MAVFQRPPETSCAIEPAGTSPVTVALDCSTTNRIAPELLGATTRVIVAGPLPELAPETVIQLGKPEMVQGQAGAVWMLTDKLPPAAGACNVVGETEYVQEVPDGAKRRIRLL